MKKFLLIFAMLFSIMSFGQNQTLTGVKTFTSPPKFLNLAYSGTNTKFLTLSAQNQLQWSSLLAITPATPTFSQVLTAGNTHNNTSGTPHFTLTSTNKLGYYVSDGVDLQDASTGNNATYFSAGYNANNNDGRLAALDIFNGLRLKTVAGGGTVTLKSTNITANRALEFPNASGTPALISQTITNGATITSPSEDAVYDALQLKLSDAPIDGNTYNRKDGAWELASGGGTPSLFDVLGVGGFINDFKEISFGDDTTFASSIAGARINRFGVSAQNGVDTNDFGEISLRSSPGLTEPYLKYVAINGGTASTVRVYVHNVTAATTNLELVGKSGSIPSLNTTAPSSATDTGIIGEIRVTSTFVYMCIATNTWVRAAMTTW